MGSSIHNRIALVAGKYATSFAFKYLFWIEVPDHATLRVRRGDQSDRQSSLDDEPQKGAPHAAQPADSDPWEPRVNHSLHRPYVDRILQ